MIYKFKLKTQLFKKLPRTTGTSFVLLHLMSECSCWYLRVQPDFLKDGDVKPEQCHFRKRQTTPVGVKERVQAYSTILEQLVTELHEHLDMLRINLILCNDRCINFAK